MSGNAARALGLTDPAESHAVETRSVVIEPPARWEALWLGEVWAYRELLYFLTWRDVKVRYKQTAIGAALAELHPLLAMAVFSIVFGVLIRVPSDGLPYPVFAYVALLPWTFFSTALIRASFSLVNDASLITKVYFPRLLLPASAVLVMTLDFGVAFVLLLAMVAWYGIVPGVALLILPRSPTRAASFRSGGERSRPQWSRSCLSGACSSSVGWRMHLRMWCD